MKEFVLGFYDRATGGTKPHLARYEGKTATEASAALRNDFPKAEVFAAIEASDNVDKIFSAFKNADQAELDKLQPEIDDVNKKFNLKSTAAANAAKADAMRRDNNAKVIETRVMDRGEMSQEDWNAICSNMTPQEKDELYAELMANAEQNWKDDPANLALEKQFINYVFGVKEKGKWANTGMTARKLGELLGISHVMVQKVQKQALKKIVNNLCKIKHYPFKVSSAEEAIALLKADYIADPSKFHAQFNMPGEEKKSFEEFLSTITSSMRAQEKAAEAKQKSNDREYRKQYAEFKRLESECNQLRKSLGLPPRYETIFKTLVSQKLGNF